MEEVQLYIKIPKWLHRWVHKEAERRYQSAKGYLNLLIHKAHDDSKPSRRNPLSAAESVQSPWVPHEDPEVATWICEQAALTGHTPRGYIHPKN